MIKSSHILLSPWWYMYFTISSNKFLWQFGIPLITVMILIENWVHLLIDKIIVIFKKVFDFCENLKRIPKTVIEFCKKFSIFQKAFELFKVFEYFKNFLNFSKCFEFFKTFWNFSKSFWIFQKVDDRQTDRQTDMTYVYMRLAVA